MMTLIKFRTIIKQKYRDIIFWWFLHFIYNKFKIYIVHDKLELEEIFGLRYQVYCLEYGYIDFKQFVDELESDVWDEYSNHLVVRDKANEIIATVRLIRHNEKGFPIQQHFSIAKTLNSEEIRHCAEISRFIVSKKYRKRHIMYVLIKGVYIFVKHENLKFFYSVMDDRLYPILTRLGLPFHKLGPTMDFQGKTFPCLINMDELEESIKKNNIRLFNFLRSGSVKHSQDETQHNIIFH